eukprot:TRINITY_DN16615_c0_g1_i1.p1 TRINITY_DN16615_c0_g1~~TRINITY_DN16615_c0_g1_i1.p1  ORF type:complete len:553 (+),score=74.82 TRINITY_DN16615_c0_g1_i1:43-1701(+)
MRKSFVYLAESLSSEVTSALYRAQGKIQRIRWSNDEETYSQLIREAGTWQNMQRLLEASDCPSPLKICEDAKNLKIILEDKAVAKLLSEVRHNIGAEPEKVNRRKMLLTEAVDVQWHARRHHIFGPSSITSFIACCSEVPNLELALDAAALFGVHPVPNATWQTLLITAKNAGNFSIATEIMDKLPSQPPKLLATYLQCGMATGQSEDTMIEILEGIPRESLWVVHAEIVLETVSTVDGIRRVQHALYDCGLVPSPKVNKYIVRILLSEGKVSECEEIAAIQKVVTDEVHGLLRRKIPDGMEWLSYSLQQAGLDVVVNSGQVDQRVQSSTPADHQYEDKKLVATVSAGQGALATAMALSGAPAASTIPFAGPVAMCSALAGSGPGRDKQTITAASLLGSAAWAGAAIAGTPPVAASAVGSMVSYSTAKMLSLKKNKKGPLPTQSIISHLLKSGSVVYRGCVTEILTTIIASPIPLFVNRSNASTDDEYRITVNKPTFSNSRLLRVTSDNIKKTLALMGNKTFRILREKDIYVFIVFQLEKVGEYQPSPQDAD